MAENIWEQAVETFLASDRGIFLNPQYLIGERGVWEANPDFLAIVFPERQIWMVEVSKTPQRKFPSKIKEFRTEYAHRIREQLEKHRVIEGTGWALDLWLFVPRSEVEKFERLATAACGSRSKITALEDTLNPTVLNTRFRE